ncbi:hypothetical protein ACF07Y_46335 [Streptomyces sp. NPDC016566]|uniref:hypothetical protein n=1 Tax=Streptomyces sp. NPDC016566 TaxID=3364967 RepID=UPI0037033D36
MDQVWRPPLTPFRFDSGADPSDNYAEPLPHQGDGVLPLLVGGVVLTERFRHATRTWQWELLRGPGTECLTDSAAWHLQDQLGAVPSELIGLGKVHPDAAVMAEPVLL